MFVARHHVGSDQRDRRRAAPIERERPGVASADIVFGVVAQSNDFKQFARCCSTTPIPSLGINRCCGMVHSGSGQNWFDRPGYPLDNPAFAFPPVRRSPCGPLAQSVEQLAFNQLVGGSNPPRPTNNIPSLHPLVAWLTGGARRETGFEPAVHFHRCASGYARKSRAHLHVRPFAGATVRRTLATTPPHPPRPTNHRPSVTERFRKSTVPAPARI